MRRVLISTLLAGMLAVAATLSWAAGLNPFGPSGMPLTANDYKDLAAAADPLLNDDSLPIGASRNWSNPNSGNSGTITLEKRFQYDYQGTQLPCRTLRYHVVIKNYSDPYNIRLNRCRIADGSWKLL